MANVRDKSEIWGSMRMDWLAGLEPSQALAFGAGVLFLVAGWGLYWLSLHGVGAVILGGAGLLAANAATRGLELSAAPEMLIQLGVAALGCLIGFFLARILHAVVFFLMGASAGAASFYSVMEAIRQDPPYDWIGNDAFFAFGVPIAGLLLGIAAVLLSKYLIVAATGLLGAGLFMEGLEWELGPFAFVGLALLGVGIQLSLSRPWKGNKKTEEA